MKLNTMADNHKREISVIAWDTECRSEVFNKNLKAFLSYENYGDHGESWIVIMEDDIEIGRIFAPSVERIVWA